MLMELLMLIPAMRAIEPRATTQLHRELSRRGFRYIPAVGTAAGLSGLATLFYDHDFGDAARVLTTIGVALLLVGLATTIRFYDPIDSAMKSWSMESVAPEYESTSSGWLRVHVFRTAFYTSGFACLVAAATAV